MPRKLIKDSYRGWYGWEDRFNSMLRMSNMALTQTNQRNERIRFEHGKRMGILSQAESRTSRKANIEIRKTRAEFIEMLAYKKAYEALSFSRKSAISPWGKRSEKSTKTMPSFSTTSNNSYLPDDGLFSQTEEETGNTTGIVEKADHGDQEVRKTTPNIKEKKADVEITVQHIQEDSNKQKKDLHANDKDSKLCEEIDNADVKDSMVNENEKCENTEKGGNYQVLYGTVRESDGAVSEMKRLSRKSTLMNKPVTPKGQSRILNGQCRSMFSIRRLTDTTAEGLIKAWSPENLRREKVRRLLQGVQFPELINRERTTSAIFRGFAKYKENEEEHQKYYKPKKNRRPVTFQDPNAPIMSQSYRRSKTVV